MIQRYDYLAPDANITVLRLHSGLLVVSVEEETGSSSGENVTMEDEYDPW